MSLPISGQVPNGFREISADLITRALLVMEIDHYKIHEGESFTVQYEQTAPTDIGSETAIGFITPSLPTRIHLIVDAWADDESVFEIREAPSVTLNAGSALAPLNRERCGDESVIIDQATVPAAGFVTTYNVAQANTANLAGGTILHHETLAIAAGPPFASKLNTVLRGSREFMLLPETKYVVILTNATANNTVHNIILNFYEHASKT